MKYVFIAIVVFFMVVNVPLWALEIETHDMSIGVEIENTFSDDDTIQGYVLTAPYLSHSFEPSVTENISFSVDSEISFTIEKTEADDESGNSVNVSTEPALEWSPTEEINLGETLSFEFSNYKSSEEDADRENSFELSSFTELGFSKMEEDLPGISPWESFQRGFEVTGLYTRQLYSKDAGEKAKELDYSAGFEIVYAYFNEASFFMLKPSFSLSKHLNDKVDESLEMEFIMNAAKDFTVFLTGTTDVSLNMVKPDSDTDMETELGLSVNAIVNKIEKLEISAGVNFSKSISEDEADPAYGFTIGIEYELFAKE